MSDKPIIFYDYELHFRNGSKEYVTVQEGRDIIDVELDPLHFEIHHADNVLESVTVYRDSLASIRSARRQVVEPVTIDDLIDRRQSGATH